MEITIDDIGQYDSDEEELLSSLSEMKITFDNNSPAHKPENTKQNIEKKKVIKKSTKTTKNDKIISSWLDKLISQILNNSQPTGEKTICPIPNDYHPCQPQPESPTSISYFTHGLQTSFSVPSLKVMSDKFQYLRDLPLPEQRTEAWYRFRNDRLTASDLGMLFGSKSEYQTCLLRKCRTLTEVKSARSGGGAACQHGIKYEDVAIQIYEYRNSVKVHDFGCIPHATLSCFAASPDGICDTSNPVYAGRMVEIKCPYSRELGPTVNPHPIKDVYWAQMQGQLEVCNLPYCDFLECVIKEYPDLEHFLQDSDSSGYTRRNGMEKGVIATQNPFTNRQKFHYSPLGLSPSKCKKWCQNHLDQGHILTYWYLEQYVCRLVARNPDWWSQVKPHVLEFWNRVEYYRSHSKYHLYPQKIQKRFQESYRSKDGFVCPLCRSKFLLDDNIVPHPNRDCEHFFHQDCLEQYWIKTHNGDSNRYPGDPQSLLSTCLLDSDSD